MTKKNQTETQTQTETETVEPETVDLRAMEPAKNRKVSVVAFPMSKIAGYTDAANLFPAISEEDARAIAHDMANRGQLEPIRITADGWIIDGRNRHTAAEINGWETIDAIVVEHEDEDDQMHASVSANLIRRDLQPSQRAAIAVKATTLIAYFRDLASENRGGRGKTAEKKVSVRKELAERFKVSEGTIAAAQSILRNEKGKALPKDKFDQRMRLLNMVRDNPNLSVHTAKKIVTDGIAKVHEVERWAKDAKKKAEKEGATHEQVQKAQVEKIREKIRQSTGGPGGGNQHTTETEPEEQGTEAKAGDTLTAVLTLLRAEGFTDVEVQRIALAAVEAAEPHTLERIRDAAQARLPVEEIAESA